MFKAACCIAASVLLYLPVAFWLYSLAPDKPEERAAFADHFVIPPCCNPQQGERFAYLGGIIFLPMALFGLAFAWRRWGSQLKPLPLAIALGFEVAFAGYFLILSWLPLFLNNYYHLSLNLFFLYPLLAVPIVPAVVLAMRWDLGGRRFIRPLLHLLAFGLAGVVFLGCVFNDKGAYSGGPHFNAVFFPVVQVYEGKALLINCTSQYGLYPHLLQPLFAVIGLTILSFSLVMALLTAGSYAAMWGFLSRICANKSAAFIGFAALLFNGWFSFIDRAQFDLYFQYNPIRLVFPAILVLLAWRYLRQPTRWLYWGLLVFLAVGVLWNLDSGLPSLLAWAMTLCFAELFGNDWRSVARRIAGHMAAAGCVLTTVVILYSSVIRLRYGSFPNYGQFFTYQRLYFLSGYNKSILTPPTTWAFVALVYLTGLAYAAFALAERRGTPRAIMVFLLSVLGVGLSSYYQGLSHPIVLFLIWWPCLLLLTLFLDDLLLNLKQNPARLSPWFATAVISWFLVGSACSLAPELQLVGNVIVANYRLMSDPKAPRQRQEEAGLLTRCVPPGQKLVIADAYSALIHLASKRPAVNPSSLFQMILMDEFAQLEQVLAQQPSTLVLIDKSTFALAGWQANDRGLQELTELLRKKYEVAAATQSDYLFARRPEGPLLLKDEDGGVIHMEVRDGAPLAGLAFAPFSTKPPWSLELVVKPGAAQGPYAALVGNHPGRGIGGFVIHQETPGVFTLLAGDGKAWQHILQFSLRPGEWNYLALVRTENAFTLYLDGQPIASRAVPGLQIEEIPLPLQVGDWLGNNRPFNGAVKEVRVLNRALAPVEIAAAAGTIRSKLP